jgi:hypothetical protein
MTDVATERVGKAYMCNDGLVRLITGLSRRNYYSILWREPNDDVWYSGGIVKTEKFPWGWEIERPPPTSPDCLRRCVAMPWTRNLTPALLKYSSVRTDGYGYVSLGGGDKIATSTQSRRALRSCKRLSTMRRKGNETQNRTPKSARSANASREWSK